MTSYARARYRVRDRYWTPERIDAVKEWYNKPFTPRAEIIVPAIGGSLMFFLFLVIYLSI